MKPSLLNFAWLLAGICAAGTGYAQTTTYQFINLGTGTPDAINDLGQVVGQSNGGATIWNGTTATALSSTTNSYAYAINDAGQIVGSTYSLAIHNYVPVEWTGGTQTALPAGTPGSGLATGINQSGQIAGDANGNAFIWSNGAPTGLTVGVGNFLTAATGINNAGQASGFVNANSGQTEAVFWSGTGNGTVLNSLGGSFSQANAINSAGEVVGESTNAAGIQYATKWNGTTVTALPSLGGLHSYAYGINNAGLIVGSSTDATGHVFATLWNGTSVVNLNDYLTPAERQAGWVLTAASGINQNGWIIGGAENDMEGAHDAFVLKVVNAVPESDTWAMLLAGITLIGSLAWFKPALFRAGTGAERGQFRAANLAHAGFANA